MCVTELSSGSPSEILRFENGLSSLLLSPSFPGASSSFWRPMNLEENILSF